MADGAPSTKLRRTAPTRASYSIDEITIIEALDDPKLFASWFPGESWNTWRAVLKAAYALPMTAADRELFARVAGPRKLPSRRVRELWVVAGRRGGKDSIASVIAAHAAVLGNFRQHLRRGERATVMCIACDRDQARIVLNYIRSFFHDSPLLRPLVQRENSDGLELSNGIDVAVHTNSYRAVRGRAIAAAIFDECAFWRDAEYALPDVETYNAVVPGLATLPGSMLVGISTPYKRSGLLFDKWVRHFGRDDDDVLVVHGPSLIFNPTLDPAVIDAALERDPPAAAAEWLAEWRNDISGFLDADWVERAASLEPGELPHRQDFEYCGFIDPSGGRNDAMTLGIAHRESLTNLDAPVIVDLVRGRRAPFDPSSVVAEFATVMDRFGLSRATADRYAAEWVTAAFADHGKTVEPSTKSKSEVYLETEPLFAQGIIKIPNERTLVSELRNLERRTHRGGRDSVDHPAGGKDDFANACCGAAWLASRHNALAVWERLAID